MTSRRRALGAITGALASLASGGIAQPVRTLPRLGYLHPASAEGSSIYKELILGLAALGYIDGKTIKLELRSGNGKPEALAALVDELLRLNVDALLVVGPAAVRATLAATRTVPIIAIDLESDPVQNGWMQTLSRPGTNVTGFFLDLTAMSAKWLQLLREVAPGTRKISLLWDTSTGEAQLTATRAAAATLAIDLQTIALKDWATFDVAMGDGANAKTQALVVLSSPTAFQFSARIADFTQRHRLPAIAPFRPFAEAGGLMSYGPNLDLFFQRPPLMIDRILRGARPADVAAEQPVKYELVINLRTAKALGLTIPQALLLRADEVIQ